MDLKIGLVLHFHSKINLETNVHINNARDWQQKPLEQLLCASDPLPIPPANYVIVRTWA